ncbi:hypothetical protein [Pseudomonas oryzihabitans]|uniref:Uncharacterized protein n=1 Tax=Pseudomonas oryzihabitans TaxID=47885 RepID=A0A2Z5ABW5_9PSED|nr:hypothetical protein [Pseudomonas oryzihabitans]AXA66770.1 hypothetical protein CE139_13385 [Pseudomonas oryzihabitans]
MTMGEGEYELHTIFLSHLNLKTVMDHARVDPAFMAQLIKRLEERGENRTGEENSLLEWARSTSRSQRVDR